MSHGQCVVPSLVDRSLLYQATRLLASAPLGAHTLHKGEIKPGFSLFFCPSARTYSNSSSSNSWCLSPATISSHLLSSCCHRPSRVSQVRSQPSRCPPSCFQYPITCPSPTHLLCSCLPRPATDTKSIPATSANPGSSPDLPAPGWTLYTGKTFHRVCQASGRGVS